MVKPVKNLPGIERPEKSGAGRSRSRTALRQSEDHIAKHPLIVGDPGSRLPEERIRALQIYQIELEMQNKALLEAQKITEESRDWYASLYASAPVGFLILTKNGLINDGNSTAASFLGIRQKELTKSRFDAFVVDDELERWNRCFTTALGSPHKQACEMRLRKGDGTLFSAKLESIRQARRGLGPVIRMTIMDTTDRVRAEEELARKTRELDELKEAFTTITIGQEKLRQHEITLTDALAEKEVLLSEIHHRVKNNLTSFISLLSLEGSYEDSAAGLALKKDLQNRARTMALIHETLYRTRQFSEVNMELYLSTLVNQVLNSYVSAKSVKTSVEAPGVTLDLARATPAGLIINELLTNSLKYAFPEGAVSGACRKGDPCTISVSLSLDDNMYTMRVADNGVGLPPDFDIYQTQSLGLKLVNFLSRHQLRANVEVNSSKGTEFVFRFKE